MLFYASALSTVLAIALPRAFLMLPYASALLFSAFYFTLFFRSLPTDSDILAAFLSAVEETVVVDLRFASMIRLVRAGYFQNKIKINYIDIKIIKINFKYF